MTQKTMVLGAALCATAVAQAAEYGLTVEPFALSQVRLLDGPFREAMERDHRYLLSLDPDRLLHTEPLETATLIPMGCARLRITAFPVVDASPADPRSR